MASSASYVHATKKDGSKFWKPYSFIARPARSLDGDMSHNWRAFLAEAKNDSDSKWRLYGKVCAMDFEISEIMKKFEQKCNEDGHEDSHEDGHDDSLTPFPNFNEVEYFDPDQADHYNDDEINELIELFEEEA